MSKIFIIKQEVKGHMFHVVSAETPDEARKTYLDGYPVDMVYTITEETISDCEEVDLDNLDEMDYTVQRAIKWLHQDDEREPEPVKPKRKRGRPKKSETKN